MSQKIIDMGVEKESFPRGEQKKLLENISHDIEGERGEGVTLTKPPEIGSTFWGR
jgi:hypothetical protein